MGMLNLKKVKKEAVKMTKIYLKIIVLLLLMSCNKYQKLIPNNNKGVYSLQVSKVKSKNDSITFIVSAYDLHTKKPIKKGTKVYLFEDLLIQEKSQYLRSEFTTTPPFFTINSFGYKPLETNRIPLKKGNVYNVNVFLEPNNNLIIN